MLEDCLVRNARNFIVIVWAVPTKMRSPAEDAKWMEAVLVSRMKR